MRNSGCPFAPAGFSLVEVLVASAVLASGVLALVQLVALATGSNIVSSRATRAAILASQKLEELRMDAGLAPSPPTSLRENVSGYVDHLDAAGRRVGDEGPAPAGALYTRRWSIAPLPSDPGRTLVVQVLVTGAVRQAGARTHADVHLVAVATRTSR